jgi:hypothetical protein
VDGLNTVSLLLVQGHNPASSGGDAATYAIASLIGSGLAPPV